MTTPAAPEICTDESCDGNFYAKGFCKKHYNAELKRTGRTKKSPCVVDGCTRMTYGRYCSSHGRRKRAGILDAPIQGYGYGDGCSSDDCDGGHYAKGLCRKHYRRAHPEWEPPKQDHVKNALQWKYGITPDERAAIEDYQGGVCAVCKEPPPDGKVLFVDHDHSHCDRGNPKLGCRYCVRGLLCNTCNCWVEKAERHPELAAPVRDYLADPPAFHVIERAPEPRKKPFADALELLQELGLRD